MGSAMRRVVVQVGRETVFRRCTVSARSRDSSTVGFGKLGVRLRVGFAQGSGTVRGRVRYGERTDSGSSKDGKGTWKGWRQGTVEQGGEVPAALWWTFASLQSPVRRRWRAAGDREREAERYSGTEARDDRTGRHRIKLKEGSEDRVSEVLGIHTHGEAQKYRFDNGLRCQ